MAASENIKCVVVGDGAVGKTCLLISYTSNVRQLQRERVRGRREREPGPVGHGRAGGLRPAPPAELPGHAPLHCVLLGGEWVPEVRHNAGMGVPILIVGTKVDLRKNEKALAELKMENHVPLTPKDGETLAAELGAVGYMECSALSQVGLKAIFDTAIRRVLSTREKPKKVVKRRCTIL